jgi:hypothetical protein
MNLSNMCPIPFTWVPYFLDFKTPYAALQMGHALITTLGTVEHHTRVGPLLDWLQVTCVPTVSSSVAPMSATMARTPVLAGGLLAPTGEK